MVDIKSFVDSAQLSFAIGKSFRILMILLLEGKLRTIDFAGPDWLIIGHNFA